MLVCKILDFFLIMKFSHFCLVFLKDENIVAFLKLKEIIYILRNRQSHISGDKPVHLLLMPSLSLFE